MRLGRADLLVHVVDVSHPSFEDHIKVVNQTLSELKCSDRPTLLVFNKMDMYRIQNEEGEFVPLTLEGFKNSFIEKSHAPCVFISAANRTNIDELRKMLLEQVRKQYSVRYPYLVSRYLAKS